MWKPVKRSVGCSLLVADLLKGKTDGIDATTLAANAALRSIVRRTRVWARRDFLSRLAQESGMATPTQEELAKLGLMPAH